MYATPDFDAEVNFGKTENGLQIFDEICMTETLNTNSSFANTQNEDTKSETMCDPRKGHRSSLITEGRQMQIFSILQNGENENSNPRPET